MIGAVLFLLGHKIAAQTSQVRWTFFLCPLTNLQQIDLTALRFKWQDAEHFEWCKNITDATLFFV